MGSIDAVSLDAHEGPMQDELGNIWKLNKDVPYTVENCMHLVIGAAAARYPQKQAVDSWDGKLTYAELDSISTRLACHLARLGVGSEVIVPLCFEKTMWTVVTMLGVLKAGGAFALLDMTQPEIRLRSIIEQCRAKIACSSSRNRDLCSRLAAEVVVVDSESRDKWPQGGEILLQEPNPHSPMYVCFTSGSTGLPKGIVITHSSFCTALQHQIDSLGFRSDSRVFDFASYSFDVAVHNSMATLSVGACLCVPSDEQRKGRLNETLKSMNVTLVNLTPSVARLLEPRTLPSLQTLILLGEAVNRVDLERLWDGLTIINTYGPAECTPVSTINATASTPEEAMNIGRGVGVLTWVVDPDNPSRLVPPGVVGELLLEGPILAREYLGQPEKTAAAFIEDPPWLIQGTSTQPGRRGRLYMTGDLVRLNKNGGLSFFGRKDTQVKIRGQRLELGEVEHHLQECLPLAGQVVADTIDLTGESNTTMLAAFIGHGEGASDTNGTLHGSLQIAEGMELAYVHTEIEAELLRRLPVYMMPTVYFRIHTMPMTPSGKTDRKKLREMGSRLSAKQLSELRTIIQGAKRLPQTNNELRLRELWARVLDVNVDDIGIDDSFFRLGGDSIAAMRLVGIAEKAGVGISVADILRQPVLTDQALGLATLDGFVKEEVKPFSLLDIGMADRGIHEELARLCAVNASVIEDAYPCTQLQEGLMSLSTKRSGDYLLQAVLELSDDVQLDAFKESWEMVVRSTAILRTRIVQHRELGLVQVVCKDGIVWNQGTGLEEYMTKEKKSAQMELGDCLSRFALISDTEGQTRWFIWTLHHALYDGWSLPLVTDLVGMAYQGKGISAIANGGTQFTTFIKYLLKVNDAEAEAYWRSYFTDVHFTQFPPLPPSVQSPVADATLSIKHELSSTRTTDVTLSTIIRASLAILIAGYTGSDDVVFGATLSGRSAPVAGIEDIIGPTITTAPIRMQLRKDETISEFLQAVQRQSSEMIPYEQFGLQRIAKLDSGGLDVCDFQTLLVVQPQGDELQANGIPGTWRKTSESLEISTYALTLEYLLGNEDVEIRATFDTAVIDRWHMTQMLQQLSTIFQRLGSAQMSQTVGDIHAMTVFDEKTMWDWNRPLSDVPSTTIHSHIAKHVRARPEALAIDAWDGKMTYSEVDKYSSQLSHHLASLGVGPEAVVPLCFEKSMWTTVAILSVLKAGGAFILLDPGLPELRMNKICQQVQAKVAITSISCQKRLAAFTQHTITLSMDMLRKLSPSRSPSPSQSGPTNAAYIIFTSGSTGEPKGCVIEHQAYCSAAAGGKVLGMNQDTRALQFSSYNFAGAIMETLMTLMHGGCVCIPSEEDRGSQLAAAIRRLDANWAFLTPTVLGLLGEPEKVPCLKTICVGGEPIRSSQIKDWASKVHLRQTYGSAETSAVVSSERLNQSSAVNNVGKPITGKYWIVSPTDSNQLIPVGMPGEIIIEGPIIGREYIGQLDKSSAAFIPAPPWRPTLGPVGETCRFYKTGDLAAFRSDGSIKLLGRKDTQVKLRGQRIEVGEIEHQARLSAPDDIREVAVELAALADSSRGPELIGFLVLVASKDSCNGDYNKQTGAAIQKVQAWLEEALPHYMVPSVLVLISALPLTPSGKTDRRQLRKMASALSQQQLFKLRQAASGSGEKRQPRNEAEQQLQGLWAQVLNVEATESIGIDDSFFRLGGDSIAAMKLVSLARNAGTTMAVADIFRHPTLIAQAQLTQSTMEPERVEETIPPFSLLRSIKTAEDECKVLAHLCHVDSSLIEDAYPCTPLQEGLLSLTAKRDGDYIMQSVFELSDTTDLVMLQNAWDEVVCSTPILRTRVVQHHEAGLVQVVLKSALEWKYARNLAEYLHTDKLVPMELGGQLSRFVIVDDNTHRWLVWTVHHALYDGWSLPLILDLVGCAYRRQGTRTQRGFNAFVQHVEELKGQQVEAYWQSYFQDGEFATFPSLPSTMQEVTVDSNCEIDIPMAGNTDVTTSALIRGSLALLLSQYTLSRDVLFGAVVSGRIAPVIGIEDVVGPTIATVPVRVKLEQDETVEDYLRSLLLQSIEMVPYEQTGLQRIAKMGGDRRGDVCGFQTLLVVQPADADDSLESESHAELWRMSKKAQKGFATYALTLECRVERERIKVMASFDSSVIDQWKMEHLLQQLSTAFQQLATASQGNRMVKSISTFTEKDKLTLLEWNTKVSPNKTTRCIHSLIAEQALARPDAMAVCAWDGELTYRKLDELSTRLACCLLRHNITPEMVIPLCFEKSMWTVVAILGVLKAGGAFVLIDPGLPESRINKICQQVQATAVAITSVSCQTRLSTFTKHTIVLSMDMLMQLPINFTTLPPCQVDPANAAYIIFTSGSTGEPKGCVIEHQAYCSAALGHGKILGMGQDTRALQFSSYNFAGAIMEMLMTLIYSGCVCIPSEEDRGQLATTIRRLDANWAFLTPTVLGLLKPEDVPCLETICVGGEPIRSSQIKDWSHIHLRQTYGSAETSAVVSSARLNYTSSVIGHVGKPTTGRYWIVNPTDSNQLIPVGMPGEIIIEGPTIGREYIGQLHKPAFISAPSWRAAFGPLEEAHRFYKTGDLAAFRSDGSIELLGRKDTQVKLRGQRIEVGEIEYQARLSTPDIKEVAVELTALADSSRGPELIGFLVLAAPQDGSAASGDAILADYNKPSVIQSVQSRLEETLPHYMVPSILIAVPVLPLTASGKIDRRKLREMGSALSQQQLANLRQAASAEKRQPRNEAERQLQGLWAQVLNIEADSIGIDDSFFRLGGDSVAAMKLVSLARNAGTALAVADIFRHPTLIAQVQASSNAEDVGWETVPSFALVSTEETTESLCKNLAALCSIDASLIEDAYPCTPLQEGLLSLTAQRDGNYIMQAVFELSQDIDIGRLKLAWDDVVRLTPVLRTRIVQYTNFEFLQVVVDENICWTEAVGLDDHLVRDRKLTMTANQPLSRCALVKDEAGMCRWLVWTAHHALYDGWSMMLIIDAINQRYRGQALVPGAQFQLFLQYMKSLDEESVKHYWEGALADCQCTPFPALPPSVKQPVSDTVMRHQFSQPSRRSANVTTSTLIHAALALAISRMTTSEDVVFGLTVSGRKAPVTGIEAMAGPTFATVPLRVEVLSDQKVLEFLDALQQQVTDMIPFEQAGLHRIAKMSAGARQACMFQTLLVIQPEERSDDEQVFGTLMEDDQPQWFNPYALMIEVQLGVDRVTISASFDSTVMTPPAVRQLLKSIELATEQLHTCFSETSLGDVNILTPNDLESIWEWNSHVPSSVPRCIHDLVKEQAEAQPNAPAVYAWDGELTYGELDQLASRLAGRLVSLGVGPDMLVPLCFEKSMWTAVAMLGVLKAGGAFVMLVPDLPEHRLQQIFQQCDASLVLSSSSNLPLSSRLCETVIEVAAASMSTKVFDSAARQGPQTQPSSTAMFAIFTSGSTGVPKGVVLTHENFCSGLKYQAKRLDFKCDSRVFDFASYTFDISIHNYFATFATGGCLCVPAESDRKNNIAETMAAMRVTIANLTPTVARLLDPMAVPDLETLILVGEAVSLDDALHWWGRARVINGYGPAECLVISTLNDEASSPEEATKIGKGAGLLTWVVDPRNHDILLPLGCVGELLLEGPLVGRGYLKDKEKTAAAFIEDPPWLLRGAPRHSGRRGRLYKTGDLVRYTDDGALAFVGRKDAQVKLRGHRIELGEVEHQVQRCMPEVRQVVAEIIVPSGDNSSPNLVAYLQIDGLVTEAEESRAGAKVLAMTAQVEDELAKLLPAYMVPTAFLAMSRFPLTSSGKTNRRQLREIGESFSTQQLAEMRTAGQGAKRQPTTQVERQVQKIWAQVIKMDLATIGLDDSFFKLGGDSIAAMKVVGECRKMGIELTVADIFKHPRLYDLASHAIASVEGTSNDIPHSQYNGPVEQSFAQGRLWFMDQLHPDLTWYLMPCAVRLRGPLHTDALNAAVRTVMGRHEILRTVFSSQNGVAMQEVLPLQTTELEVVDLSLEGSLSQALHQDQTTPFDLQNEVAWRIRVYHLNETEHVLSIVMHHIISDGWSVDVLQKELSAFYSASIRGQDPASQLDPLPIQYRDFSVWEKETARVRQDDQLEYWLTQLESSQPAELMCDNPRPPVLSGKAGVQELRIEDSLYEELRGFCTEHGVTPFVALLAAFRATHYRLTGEPDATIGSPHAGRDRWDIINVIGFFVNMQCLRIKIEDESLTYEDLVQQTQATTTAAFANQDVPFEVIVSKLQVARDLSRQPMVQIIFAVHSQQGLGEFAFEGVKTEFIDHAVTSRFDLEFHFFQEDKALRGEVFYSTDLYAPETITNMLSVFRRLLEQALLEPRRAVAQLSLMTADSYSALDSMGLIQMPHATYPRNSSIVDVFCQQVAVHPSRIAVKDDSAELTYAQLHTQSDAVAQWLAMKRLDPETLVGVYCNRSCQTIAVMLGILKASLAYLPFDTKTPASRMESILLSIDKIKFVIVGSSIQPPVLSIADIEFVPIIDVLNGEFSNHQNGQNVMAKVLPPSATSLAYVMFTSGSTGIPKGVMVEHRNILRLVKQSNVIHHKTAGGIMAHITSLAFDVSTWEIFVTLLNGGTLICIDTMAMLDYEALSNIFVQEKVETLCITPALLKHYLSGCPGALSVLDTIYVGGERADARDLVRARELMRGTIVNAYGPTENTGYSTSYLLPPEDMCANGVPIGRAVSNSGAYVVDCQCRLVPLGIVGELVVTGDGLARGYTNSRLNTDRFISIMIDQQPIRAYRTGDYVRYRSDGQLEFLKRMDGQIKIRGHRVELGEIEHVLSSHESVDAATVVLHPKSDGDAELVGFVTLRKLNAKELIERIDQPTDDDEKLQVGIWEDLFDSDTYSSISNVQPEMIGRDFIGWTSMYDGSDINKTAMNEWLDDTMETINSSCGDSINVLEIGSGTGMILFNLTEKLNSYIGVDPSEKAVNFITKTSRSIPKLLNKVHMYKGTAADISRLERTSTPDLIIVNSVAQYFPSQDYLLKLIEDVIRLDSQGPKTIFFGDMRSLALYAEFRVTKILHMTGDNATKAEIRQRVAELGQSELELLVDPAFFTSLSSRFPNLIEHVEIIPKRMRATNELSCYRYAAVVHIKDQSQTPRQRRQIHTVASDAWVDFMESKLDRATLLQQLLQKPSGSSIVAISNIPHSKTIFERHVVDSLSNMSEGVNDGVDWLPSIRQKAKHSRSLSAADLVDLAHQAGYQVEISWARQHTQRGGLDAIFHRYPTPDTHGRVLFGFPTDHQDRSSDLLSTQPLQQLVKQKIRDELHLKLQSELPSYMIPRLIKILDKMPVNSNGKVDRRALSKSIQTTTARHVSNRQPTSQAERQLQMIWSELLKIEAVAIGLDDNFFRLGGDSIMAMRLVSSARKVGLDLAVADIFRNPTLITLAKVKSTTVRQGIDNIPPFSLSLPGSGKAAESLCKDLGLLCDIDASLIEDAYPCTPLQEGLISLTAKQGGDYISQAVLELSKDVDLDSLKAAWETMANHTALLRTRIVQHHELGLVQVVCKDAIQWPLVQDLEEYLGDDKKTPMGLGTSLSRFALVTESTTSKPKWFVWTVHHALYDGWSFPRLMEGVCRAYRGYDTAKQPGFNAFVKHIERLKDAEHGTQNYWCSYLDDGEFDPFPTLPLAIQEPRADVTFNFKLTPIAKANVTTSTLIRAALAILISQQTGTTDVNFGSVVSGRNAPVEDIEDIIGPTIATVPICVQVRGDQTIARYLETVQDDATKMIPYEQAGLQNISKMSDRARDACRFQTLLVVQPDEIELKTDQLLGTWQGSSSPRQGFTTYAITLELFTGAGGMEIQASFDSRVVDRWSMDNRLRQLDTILQQLANYREGQTISDIKLLTTIDEKMIREWNNPQKSDDAARTCIHTLISEQVQAWPEALAVNAWDGKMSYKELDAYASRLSYHLASLGVGPEVVVPLCFEKSMWTVVAILGVYKAGGAFVLVDPGLPESRANKLCTQVQATVSITSVSCQTKLSTQHIVVLSMDMLVRLPSTSSVPLCPASPANMAYIVFTSGSTGEPKGCVVEHQAYCSLALSQGSVMRMSKDMRALQFGSYHFAGAIMEMLMTLIYGGCVCIISEEDRGSQLAAAICRLDANWAFLTPTVLGLLKPEQVPCLKTINIGGEPIRSSQIKDWAHIHLRQTYGCTEASAVVSSERLTGSSTIRDVGKPSIGRYWLVDPTDHQLVSVGMPGEIIIEGPTIGREYIGNPDKTAAAFISPPSWRSTFSPLEETSRFYKTGDLAIYRSDGSIQLLGRKDTQVKLRGQRIEIGEIEYQARLSTPDIREVAVELTTLADSRGPELIGFLVPAVQQEGNEVVQKAQAWLEDALPHYMVPSVLVPVPALPQTPSGKTDRRRLRKMGSALSHQQLAKLRQASSGSEEKRQPRNEAERHLQSLWAQVLNIETESIGIDDSFFQLGGDSITAMQLSAATRAELGGISTSDIMRKKTISRLVASISSTEVRPALPYIDTDDNDNEAFTLSPIQQLYVQIEPDPRRLFDLSFLLKPRSSITFASLEKALEMVVSRHPMLRARFGQKADNHWEQRIVDDVSGSFSLSEVNSTCVAEQELSQAIGRSRDSIDIEAGPILAAVLFNEVDSQKFYISIHHLVIDLVSWRIVIQELEELLTVGQVSIPPTTSFRTWSIMQAQYAAENLDLLESSPCAVQEPLLSYWGFGGHTNLLDTTSTAGFVLDDTTSSALFGGCNDAFGTRPMELLLAGLIHSFGSVFTDRPTPAVFSEGHGREPWDHQLDVSRTIGWFTAIWPTQVRRAAGDSPLDTVRQAKDYIRGLAQNGWSYFTSRFADESQAVVSSSGFPVEIMLNYVGAFQQLERADSFFESLDLPDDCHTSSHQVLRRFAMFGVTAYMDKGCLTVQVAYPTQAHHQQRIAAWIVQYQDTLRDMVTLLSSRPAEWTLTDFPMAFKSYQDISNFQSRLLPNLEVPGSDAIEDIFPCSPMQVNMLLAQQEDSRHYQSTFNFEVVCPKGCDAVNVSKIGKAWKAVVRRHSLLRALIVENVSGSDTATNIILKDPQPDIVYFRGNDGLAAHQTRQANPGPVRYRKHGLQHHLTIFEIDETRASIHLDINHAIYDAYSMLILLRDFQLAYAGELDPSGPSYGEFIQYVELQSQNADDVFWMKHLDGMKPCIFPASGSEVTGTDSFSMDASDVDANKMHAFCTKWGVTSATILQTAWALVLHKYTGSTTVCFGAPTSGRDVDVEVVNEMFGMLMNLIPCPIILDRERPVIEILRRVQDEYISTLPHQTYSLRNINRSLGISSPGLFNTTLSFHRRDETPTQSEGWHINTSQSWTGPVERDISITTADVGAAIKASFIFKSSFMSHAQAKQVVDAFGDAILAIISNPEARLEGILA